MDPFTFSTACGAWDLACRMDAHPGQAAWAQAVLSMFGILAGAYIAAKVAARPILSTRHQRLAALVGVVDAATVLLRSAKKHSDDYDVGKLGLVDPPEKFDRAIASITAIPLLDVSPGDLVSGLIELREDLAIARGVCVNLHATQVNMVTAARYMGGLIQPMIAKAEDLSGETTAAAMAASRAEREWWKP